MPNDDAQDSKSEEAKSAHLNELVKRFNGALKKNWEVIFSYDEHMSSIEHRYNVFHSELANYQASHPDMKEFKPTDKMQDAQSKYEKTYEALANTLIKTGVTANREDADNLILKLTTREIPPATQPAAPASDEQKGKEARGNIDTELEKSFGELARDKIQHNPMEQHEKPAYTLAIKSPISKSKTPSA